MGEQKVMHEWTLAGYHSRIVETQPGIVMSEQAMDDETRGRLWLPNNNPMGWQNEMIHLASEVASLKAEASLMHELQEQAGATIAALREQLRAPLATDRERRLAEAIVYLLGPAEGPDWSDATADSILNEARALLAAPSAPSEPAKAWVLKEPEKGHDGRWHAVIECHGGGSWAFGYGSEQPESARQYAINLARALGLEVR